jgi:hypothetical protein
VCGRKYYGVDAGADQTSLRQQKNIKAKSQKEGWLPLRTDRFFSKQIKSSGKIGRRSTTQNLAP